RAYETAHARSASGPLLNALFQSAFAVAKRVRSETGISHGHVSVASVAVDYVKEVFTRFDDKTVLVIGAGKMGTLTLRHLRSLNPRRILVTNRSPEKAREVAAACGGTAIPWEKLDDACAQADIVLSTTGAEPQVMPLRRWAGILARRAGGIVVVLDIAIPRDFAPEIHDGDRTCVFNIDDLQGIRDKTLAERRTHISPAETIIEEETRQSLKAWSRRLERPVMARITRGCDAKPQAIVRQLMAKLNGRLTDDERAYVEKAFHLMQNQFLPGPISALE